MHDKKEWTEGDIAKCKSLYKKGWSFASIGAEMGRSRSSIGGMIHRKGWAAQYGKGRAKGGISRPNISGSPKPPPIPAKLRKKWAKAIERLKARGCRWPVEDGAFCTKEAVQGRPYCNDHCEMAYLNFKKKAA